SDGGDLFQRAVEILLYVRPDGIELQTDRKAQRIRAKIEKRARKASERDRRCRCLNELTPRNNVFGLHQYPREASLKFFGCIAERAEAVAGRLTSAVRARSI